MIGAKNYETVFKFVKVMPRIPVASFYPDTVHVYSISWYTSRESFSSCIVLERLWVTLT